MASHAETLASPRAAPSAQPALNDILLMVGQLNYAWTNTESLLIHLIAGLARADKETAIVIFLTLNTTRARLDLVERLAKMERTSEACRDEVLTVTAALGRESRLRNKYNHCIYSFDRDGSNAKTILMRIVDDKKNIKYGKTEIIDAKEMARLHASRRTLEAVNHRIWRIVSDYGFPG
jgi:hypothetical protein